MAIPWAKSNLQQNTISMDHISYMKMSTERVPEPSLPIITEETTSNPLTHWGRDKMDANFADDIFNCISLIENIWIPIKMSLKFVPRGPINNIPALVQIMAWRRPGDKPLSETMMDSLATHICVTLPQWIKGFRRQALSVTPANGKHDLNSPKEIEETL